MQFSLYGVDFESLDDQLDNFIELLNSDDTTALYVTYDKNEIDDYDSIVLVNPKTKTLFPMFLLTFNESVNEYYTDLIDIFPDHAVIESNCTDFAVCDSYTIDAMKNVVKGSFVSHTTYENILVISVASDEEFEPFGSKKVLTKIPKSTPRNKTNNAATVSTPRSQTTQPISTATQKPVSTIQNPVETTVDIKKQQPVSVKLTEEPKVAAPIFVIDDEEEEELIIDKPVVQPEPKHIYREPVQKPVYKEPVQKPKTVEITPQLTKKVPSQKNLYSYCKYNEDVLVVNLMANKELVFINRITGYINRIKLQTILENDIIGYDNEMDIVKQFGKIPMIPHETKAVKLVDIRQIIKYLEPRKESPVTKQVIAYDAGMLYVAIPSKEALDEGQSIKGFTINCHKKSIELYEVLKIKTQSYSKTLYCLITMDGVGVAAVGAKGDLKLFTSEQILAYMPELNNVSDIIRLFPIDKIIDGSSISLSNPTNVSGFVSVPAKNILLLANQYIAKNMIYSYDTKSKTILYAIKPSD